MTTLIKVISILSILSIAIGVRITADDSCAPNSLTYTADLSTTSKWDHYWERCVGSGHALLGLRHDWREHLRHAREACGFQRVRFHGLFDDDMSTYTIIEGQPSYSFFNIDSVYDYMLELGMQPLVELSFMPELIASGNQTIFHYKGNITPPQKYSDWFTLVQTFVKHLVDRYTLNEVRTWFFEAWNEPNCGFWTGDQQDYFELLKTTVAAVKSVDSRLQVGGPATCQSQWLTETIQFCEQNNVPIDFISTHEYPTDVTPTVRNTLQQVMTKARQEVGDRPLFYTEYNDGLYSPSYHDQIFASAFAISNIIDCYGIPDLMSWWTFTDIFEEQGFSSIPFQEGFGMITIHGIPKPSFRAFELLHQTGDSRVTVQTQATNSTAGVLITKNSTHVTIIAYNHNVPNAPISTETLCITVTGVNANSPSLVPTIRRIDDDNANPIALWQQMGSPMYPTKGQIEALKRSSEMKVQTMPFTTVNSNSIQFNVKLTPEAVASIVFRLV